MRKTAAILLICLLTALPGCAAQDKMLSDLFKREKITSIQISYTSLGKNANSTLGPEDSDFALLLDAIYSAPASKTVLEGYSPEMNATHRVVMNGEINLITFFDAKKKILCVPSTKVKPISDEEYRSYLIYEADLSTILNALEGEAVAPVEPALQETVVPPDALLRSEVVSEELAKPGEPIDYEMFDYPVQKIEPLYEVQTHEDQIAGLENGYLLVVAALGEKPTTGYTVDFAEIIENESYYIVRVSSDTPAEGQETPSYPVAAALIDARRMSEDKIVVFLDEEDNILNVKRIDRAFLDQLPTDMPPLATPEPYDDTDGRTE